MNKLLGTAQLTGTQWEFASLAAVVLPLGWEVGSRTAHRRGSPRACNRAQPGDQGAELMPVPSCGDRPARGAPYAESSRDQGGASG